MKSPALTLADLSKNPRFIALCKTLRELEQVRPELERFLPEEEVDAVTNMTAIRQCREGVQNEQNVS